ncbi:MAG: hypothetical protein IJ217_00890 [Clostridia bacterium]|nr:hypothetical protein [Clostridia bacterium]
MSKKYKVMFLDFHIGDLEVSEKGYHYTANKAVIADVGNSFPIFDMLKKDVEAESIPFFKVRLEKNAESFETDDYKLIAY